MVEATIELPELTPDEQRALVALLSHPSTETAAAAIGLTSRTLRRYLARPHFAKAHRAAIGELVQEVTARLQQSLGLALRTLEEVMSGSDAPSARVSAARAVMEMAYKQNELREVEERLAHIEERALPARGGAP
jgi:hypothetical protein